MSRDRSTEFFSAVESLSIRVTDSQPLAPKLKTKSDFAKASALIARLITDTSQRLTKLTLLAKQKSLFEDKPEQINDLIYVIKQDIAKVNHQITQLTEYLGSQKDNNQTNQHSTNVISSLQSKLANTSDIFKSVLKVRSDNLKEYQERRNQYSFKADLSQPISNSPLYHPVSTNSQQVETVIDFGSSFVQQQIADPSQNNAYLNARDQTIESIESTIAELGQVYSRFASVLAEQRELVQRIDDNVENVHMNVEGAHTQLLQYYQNISSNRGLVVKSFGVVVVFFTLFVVLT